MLGCLQRMVSILPDGKRLSEPDLHHQTTLTCFSSKGYWIKQMVGVTLALFASRSLERSIIWELMICADACAREQGLDLIHYRTGAPTRNL
jgi:hypothetical protein